MSEKAIELAKKIKALVEKGEGGESVNAKKMLDALLKKHKLTLADIEEDVLNYAYYKVDEHQIKMFNQICFVVLGQSFETYKDKQKKGYLLVHCTASQAVEIELKYHFYWTLYKNEYNLFFLAFVNKNNLFPKGLKKQSIDDMTVDQIKEMERVKQMAKTIKKGQLRKRIANC